VSERVAIGATLGVLCMIVACGGAQTRPASPLPATTEGGDIPDVAERCPPIPAGCPGSGDQDGCPDLSLSLGPRCELAGRNADLLREVADAMKKDRRLTVVSIVATEKECAAQVKKRLADAGVDAARVDSRLTHPHGLELDIYFEVTAWDGKQCRDGGSAFTPPR
jgi:hypothetical protein